ncbi:hypothetical protein HDU76_003204 [Blyttiomyces sp. JEL0837]|nr:hypothetical protein HDU76_003204 [Blyttiomyces sp. JEL0837]
MPMPPPPPLSNSYSSPSSSAMPQYTDFPAADSAPGLKKSASSASLASSSGGSYGRAGGGKVMGMFFKPRSASAQSISPRMERDGDAISISSVSSSSSKYGTSGNGEAGVSMMVRGMTKGLSKFGAALTKRGGRTVNHGQPELYYSAPDLTVGSNGSDTSSNGLPHSTSMYHGRSGSTPPNQYYNQHYTDGHGSMVPPPPPPSWNRFEPVPEESELSPIPNSAAFVPMQSYYFPSSSKQQQSQPAHTNTNPDVPPPPPTTEHAPPVPLPHRLDVSVPRTNPMLISAAAKDMPMSAAWSFEEDEEKKWTRAGLTPSSGNSTGISPSTPLSVGEVGWSAAMSPLSKPQDTQQFVAQEPEKTQQSHDEDEEHPLPDLPPVNVEENRNVGISEYVTPTSTRANSLDGRDVLPKEAVIKQKENVPPVESSLPLSSQATTSVDSTSSEDRTEYPADQDINTSESQPALPRRFSSANSSHIGPGVNHKRLSATLPRSLPSSYNNTSGFPTLKESADAIEEQEEEEENEVSEDKDRRKLKASGTAGRDLTKLHVQEHAFATSPRSRTLSATLPRKLGGSALVSPPRGVPPALTLSRGAMTLHRSISVRSSHGGSGVDGNANTGGIVDSASVIQQVVQANVEITASGPQHLFWVPAHLHVDEGPMDWMGKGAAGTTGEGAILTGPSTLKRNKSIKSAASSPLAMSSSDPVDEEEGRGRRGSSGSPGREARKTSFDASSPGSSFLNVPGDAGDARNGVVTPGHHGNDDSYGVAIGGADDNMLMIETETMKRRQTLKRAKSFAERHVVITPENIDELVKDGTDEEGLIESTGVPSPVIEDTEGEADGSVDHANGVDVNGDEAGGVDGDMESGDQERGLSGQSSLSSLRRGRKVRKRSSSRRRKGSGMSSNSLLDSAESLEETVFVDGENLSGTGTTPNLSTPSLLGDTGSAVIDLTSEVGLVRRRSSKKVPISISTTTSTIGLSPPHSPSRANAAIADIAPAPVLPFDAVSALVHESMYEPPSTLATVIHAEAQARANALAAIDVQEAVQEAMDAGSDGFKTEADSVAKEELVLIPPSMAPTSGVSSWLDEVLDNTAVSSNAAAQKLNAEHVPAPMVAKGARRAPPPRWFDYGDPDVSDADSETGSDFGSDFGSDMDSDVGSDVGSEADLGSASDVGLTPEGKEAREHRHHHPGWSKALDQTDPEYLVAATEAAIVAAVPEMKSYWDPTPESEPSPIVATSLAQSGSQAGNKKGWGWITNWLPVGGNAKTPGSPQQQPKLQQQQMQQQAGSGFFGGILGPASSSPSATALQASPDGHAIPKFQPTAVVEDPVINDDENAPPILPVNAQMNGFPRFPLEIEKAIYRLSHVKLAQHRRPLIQQVEISNLMLYILSVHADVTLNRQGPRGRRKKGGMKKAKSANAAVDPDAGPRTPGRKKGKKANAGAASAGAGVPASGVPGAGGIPRNGPLLTFNTDVQSPPTAVKEAGIVAGDGSGGKLGGKVGKSAPAPVLTVPAPAATPATTTSAFTKRGKKKDSAAMPEPEVDRGAESDSGAGAAKRGWGAKRSASSSSLTLSLVSGAGTAGAPPVGGNAAPAKGGFFAGVSSLKGGVKSVSNGSLPSTAGPAAPVMALAPVKKKKGFSSSQVKEDEEDDDLPLGVLAKSGRRGSVPNLRGA